MKEVDGEVKQAYKDIDSSRSKLEASIKGYKYLLDGVNKIKLDDAIKEEIKVLNEYEKMQE